MCPYSPGGFAHPAIVFWGRVTKSDEKRADRPLSAGDKRFFPNYMKLKITFNFEQLALQFQ